VREEDFFPPQSRYVIAAYWCEVAEAAASNCRIKQEPLPSTLTNLGRPIQPRVHPGEGRSLLPALSLPNVVFVSRSQQLQDQEGATPVDFAAVSIYILASAGQGFVINSPYLRFGFSGLGY
jgi:hypothetical protein